MEFFTSESVTEGHPDKLCDSISDAILDNILAKDASARVAIETMITHGIVFIGGEITTDCYVDIPAIARGVIRDAGYTDPSYGFHFENCGVILSIHEQSKDIARGVQKEKHAKLESVGAGDQGIMFGYATDETPQFMPLPITLAHALTRRLAYVRKKKILPYLRPDGKAQVSVRYENDKPQHVEAIVVAAQHNPDVHTHILRKDIQRHVIAPVIPAKLLDTKTNYFINATGRFVLGGPQADTGLTGRKIISDTYGGVGSHGGGAFSGKDPTKVDRSGAYMARYIAKHIVAAKIAKRCEVQVAYAIGVIDPLSFSVHTFGTGVIPDEKITAIARKVFDLRPGMIIKHLGLQKPLYCQVATYGHFGRTDLKNIPWERLDKLAELKRVASATE